jgi:hypothetical protein
MFLSSILFLAFTIPFSLLSQTSSTKQHPRSNMTETLPEWNMSDEEFKSLLIKVETILPIYDSSIKEVEAYMSSLQGLSYQEGSIIQADLKNCRSDITEIHKTISSLKDLRWVMEEIDLHTELIELERDTLELEQDEVNAPMTEMNPRIKFPNPTGFDAYNNELTMPILKLAWDYVARIKYLESRASQCNIKH